MHAPVDDVWCTMCGACCVVHDVWCIIKRNAGFIYDVHKYNNSYPTARVVLAVV